MDSFEEVIEVDQFECKEASSPDVLCSGGMGPCIAIAIYDPSSKKGYMMHNPMFLQSDLDSRCSSIIRTSKDPNKLTVFALGNSLSTLDEHSQRAYEKANRSFVERILHSHFSPSQVEILWAPDDHVCTLELDTLRGEFQAEITDICEFTD